MSCPLTRKRTCALVGTIELDEAQQNHGVAAQPSRSRLVCVFRRRYSDGVGPVATYLTSVAWTQFNIGLILTIDDHRSRIATSPARWWIVCPPNACSPLLRWRRLRQRLLLAYCTNLQRGGRAKVLHAIASSLLGPTLVASALPRRPCLV
jgi:hypothetical protein